MGYVTCKMNDNNVNYGGFIMTGTCISCDLMFTLQEKGFLYVLETDVIKRVYPDAIEQNGGLYLPFYSKEDGIENVPNYSCTSKY